MCPACVWVAVPLLAASVRVARYAALQGRLSNRRVRKHCDALQGALWKRRRVTHDGHACILADVVMRACARAGLCLCACVLLEMVGAGVCLCARQDKLVELGIQELCDYIGFSCEDCCTQVLLG